MNRCFFCFLLLSAQVFGQSITLDLASSLWPPFTNTMDKKAYSRDLVSEALSRAGIKSNYLVREFTEVITGLNDGKFDGSPALWYTDERAVFLRFSKPYLENRLILVGKKGADVSASSLSELEGKRLALVGSYAYGAGVDSIDGLEIVSGLDVQGNLDLLLEGKADYMLVEELVIKYILKFQREEVEQNLEIGKNALVTRTLHFGVRKDLENSAYIIQQFDAKIMEMVADGSYNRILEMDWIQADIDGDGKSELVLLGKNAGVEAPKEAYMVPGTNPYSKPKTGFGKYLIDGQSYNSWDQVPSNYKTPNANATKINTAPVNLLKFKF